MSAPNATTTTPAYLTHRVEALGPSTVSLYCYVRPADAPSGRGTHFYYSPARTDLPTLARCIREDLRRELGTEVDDDLLYAIATAVDTAPYRGDRYHGD